MTYQTRKEIVCLSVGFRRAAGRPVAPGELPENIWSALVEEGVIAEVMPSDTDDIGEPMPPEIAKENYTKNYADMTLKQLKEEADRLGYTYPKSARKQALLDMLMSD